MALKLSVFLSLFLSGILCIAQSRAFTIDITKSFSVTYDQISYLAAGDSVVTLLDAENYLANVRFIENKKKYLNLGIVNDNYWVVLSFINNSNTFQDLLLNLENSRLNDPTPDKKEYSFYLNFDKNGMDAVEKDGRIILIDKSGKQIK